MSSPSDVLATLAGLKGVPGRLELAGEAKGGLVFVDYAHKPEALANVHRGLAALHQRPAHRRLRLRR